MDNFKGNYKDPKAIQGEVAHIIELFKDFCAEVGLRPEPEDTLRRKAAKMFAISANTRVIEYFFKTWDRDADERNLRAPSPRQFRAFYDKYTHDKSLQDLIDSRGDKEFKCEFCKDKGFLNIREILSEQLSTTTCVCQYKEPYFKTIAEGKLYFIKQGTHWPINESQCFELTEDQKKQILIDRQVTLGKLMRDVRTQAKESGKSNKLAELVFKGMSVR